MSMAPNGAVSMIARTATIRTVLAKPYSSGKFCLRTTSNAIGAKAACTKPNKRVPFDTNISEISAAKATATAVHWWQNRPYLNRSFGETRYCYICTLLPIQIGSPY